MSETIDISEFSALRLSAQKLAKALTSGSILLLYGEIGSGKTTFVAQLAEALGCKDPVSSPTFALIHRYEGQISLIHADLYRLQSEKEVANLDPDFLFNDTAITAIEWPEHALKLLSKNKKVHKLFFALTSEKRTLKIT